MKKFPLDLSQFKKVKDEKDHTVLRHPAGHEIKIAKKQLEPKLRGQLADLPIHEEKSKGNEKLEESKKDPKPVKMADGGEVAIDPSKAMQLPADMPAQQVADPSILDVLPTSTASQALAAAEAAKNADASNTIRYPASDAPPAAPQAPAVPQPQAPATPSPLAQSAAPQQSLSIDLGAQKSMIDQAYGNQMSGIQGLGHAQAQEAQDKAAALQQGIAAQDQVLKTFQDSAAKINNHIDTIAHDIEQGHIDPKRLLSNMSTGQKIATGIGLFLGGLGQGLKGGDNPALEFLNKQIDRDIESQKAEMTKKENLVSIYTKEFGNLKDGTDMARIVLNQTLQNRMLEAAAKSGSKAAMAQAQIGVGKLQQEIAPLKLSMQMNQALISASQQDAANGGGTMAQERLLPVLRQIAPDKAKEIESRLVPGVGVAEYPVTEADRSSMVNQQVALDNIKKLRAFAKENSGSLSPAKIAEGQALASLVLNQYRTATSQGTYKESQAEFDKKLVGDNPTQFFAAYRTDPRYKVLEDSIKHEQDALRAKYKLPGTTGMEGLTPQQQAFLKWAQANPKDPRAALVIKKLGR